MLTTRVKSDCLYFSIIYLFTVQCLVSLGTLDKSRIFVTIPRFSEGVPISLGYVKSPKTSCLIQPYPDYSWHSSHGANCDGITSVVRVAIDQCHQMWVLDTGAIGSTRKCPPQLLVFNLANDKLVKRYKFPEAQYTDLSLFITPVRFNVSSTYAQHSFSNFFRFSTWRTRHR